MTPAGPAGSDDTVERRLVLVTGAGRSGTSLVAGVLSALGLRVPKPVLKANATNPRGFFESQWPVRFHRELIARAAIAQWDGRPDAAAAVRAAVTEDTREKLVAWLTRKTSKRPQVLVKDPRAVWVPWLWAEAAEAVGTELGFLTMLRHPAEVLGSRTTHYAADAPSVDAFDFDVVNLCGWINSCLLIEGQTRTSRRVFVRYDDLLTDWRLTVDRIGRDLDLVLPDIAVRPHPVDDFVQPALRRHEPRWENPQLPADLVAIAEGVWAASCRLADVGGQDPAALAELDSLRERYRVLHRNARAVAMDETAWQVRVATAALRQPAAGDGDGPPARPGSLMSWLAAGRPGEPTGPASR